MTQSPASDHGHSHAHAKKKRVGKACDSCRIKKTKCDGKKPCSRCILDNKICVFTEKKKQRDKTHPSGYVELLETRLDILTKSLEKLVELSTPHLGFLQELVAEHEAKRAQAPVVAIGASSVPQSGDTRKARSSSRTVKQEFDSNDDLSDYDHSDDENDSGDDNDVLSDSAVPINKVVAYLINKESLLSTLPVEWERGALIAANLNSKDLQTSAKLFADHKSTVQDSVEDSRISSKGARPSNYTFNSPTQHTSSQSSLTDQVNLNSFSLGGYSTGGGFVLASSSSNNTPNPMRDAAAQDHHNSDIDSDSNTTSSVAHNTPLQRSSTGNGSIKLEPSSPSLDGFPKRANSLFLNSANNNSSTVVFGSVSSNNSSKSNSSVASLTSKFENQGLASPTESPQEPGFPITSSGRGLISRRTSASQRSNSPHSKIKTAGHVHKRPHPPRNESFKNGVELLNSRGRRRSSLTGPQNFPVPSHYNNQHQTQGGQAQFIVGSMQNQNGQNQSELYENVLSLSPQSTKINESQLESRYDEYGGSNLDDFSNSFSGLPSQVFKLNAQGTSPASLFDPQNQSSSYNNPYNSNVNSNPNEIVPVSGIAPPTTGLLEEEGFDFLSNSPYLA